MPHRRAGGVGRDEQGLGHVDLELLGGASVGHHHVGRVLAHVSLHLGAEPAAKLLDLVVSQRHSIISPQLTVSGAGRHIFDAPEGRPVLATHHDGAALERKV